MESVKLRYPVLLQLSSERHENPDACASRKHEQMMYVGGCSEVE